MFTPSCTAPVLSWMLSAPKLWPLRASLYCTRALLTVRLSMSSLIGRSLALSVLACAAASAGVVPAPSAGAGVAAGRGLPMSSQLPWPFSSRLRVRFRPSTRTSLICTSRRSKGSTRTDRPSICRSANGTFGLFRVAMLASCSSRPSHGNRLQPMSPLSVSSTWALSRASWRISSL
ncbi:hypothetical protein D3C85_1431470 [compost metagenome]